jgi:hypothetical protein
MTRGRSRTSPVTKPRKTLKMESRIHKMGMHYQPLLRFRAC